MDEDRDRRGRTNLRGVSRDRPCPVCNGGHKCAVGADGLILCGRRREAVPGFRYFGLADKDPQWSVFRRLGDAGLAPDAEAAPGPGRDWGAVSESFTRALTPPLAAELADLLKLPGVALEGLGLGWDAVDGCWTHPERDAAGVVVGVQRRRRDGSKRMLAGGRRGLTFAGDWRGPEGPVVCPEGFSDVAALRALGVAAVGRPSNTGGVEALAGLLAGVGDRTVIILGEADQHPDGRWPGRDGARAVARQLAVRLGRDIGVALPPGGAKDVRAWVTRAGVDLNDPASRARLGADFRRHLEEHAMLDTGWDPPIRFDDFDPPPFPVAVLPAWLGDFVAALATATQTPVDLPAMMALSALGLAAAKTAVVRVGPGYTEPLNLYTLTTQPSGSRKSAVVAAILGPIQAFEREREREIEEARARRTAAEKDLDRLRRAAGKAQGDERAALEEQVRAQEEALAGQAVSRPMRLLVEDVTPEKLEMLLDVHGGRLGGLSAEGGALNVAAGGRYGKGGGNIEVLLKGHCGDELRVDRVHRDPVRVPRPALSLGLAVQPEVLRQLGQVPGARERGLLARFLYALPRSTVGRREIDPPPMPAAVEAAFGEAMRALLRRDPAPDDAPMPELALAAEASGALRGFRAWIEPQLGEGGELADLADWASKLAGAVARLAGLLHLADHAGGGSPEAAIPESTAIPGSTMTRAIQIARYLIPHAKAAFDLMGSDAKVEDARHVLAWLERRGGSSATQREIFEGTKGRFKKVSALEPALGLLVEHGYLRKEEEGGKPGPGRPASPAYAVHPAILARSGRPSARSPHAGDFGGEPDSAVGVQPTRGGEEGPGPDGPVPDMEEEIF